MRIDRNPTYVVEYLAAGTPKYLGNSVTASSGLLPPCKGTSWHLRAEATHSIVEARRGDRNEIGPPIQHADVDEPRQGEQRPFQRSAATAAGNS